MASAANVSSAASTTSSNVQNLTPNQPNGVNRTTSRSNNNSKAGEGVRRQSPMDNTQRSNRVPSQKAWTSGINPLTQRGSTTTQANGSTLQTRNSSSSKSSTTKENESSDKHAHDRLTFFLGAALGLNLVLSTKTGDTYEGILSGSAMAGTSTRMTLKMTKKVNALQPNQVDDVASREAALTGTSPEYAMNFDLRDVADISISEFVVPEPAKLINGASSSFQTDSDISGAQSKAERPLQKWVPDGPVDTDFSLDSGGAGTWDQFATNDQLFGTKSTYDENYYTTTIDRNAPSYKRREAEAARLAREIEASSSAYAHVREERGQALENDGDDEEDKYSGVRRDDRAIPPLTVGSANKYMPPARRPPTDQPTVPGVPVDTAIISAQLAKPDSAKPTSSSLKQEKDNAGTPAKIKADTTQIADTSDAVTNGPTGVDSETESTPKFSSDQFQEELDNERAGNASASPQRDVPAEVLKHFRAFALAERTKLVERKKAQASQDLNAKLNEFVRFSKNFKLKTPIPNDLVGILAKDPAKQEAIIEKAQQQHVRSTSTVASPSTGTAAALTTATADATTAAISNGVGAVANIIAPNANTPPTAPASTSQTPPVRKFDASQIPPPIPDRQTLNRGRGGQPPGGRNDRPGQQPPSFPSRGPSTSFPQRPNGSQPDKKTAQQHPLPAPIPIVEGRIPPLGPLADQGGLTSPQRSNLHTPTSAVSSKFNVRAMEFRPNAAAPAFNPATSSNAPSSPSSVNPASSLSRATSPTSFFGARKPKPASERPSLADYFNPIKRMKEETLSRKSGDKDGKTEDGPKEQRDYSSNGGIPNAFQTGPRWIVKVANAERTYLQAFEKPSVPTTSPTQSRSSSSQQVSYPTQMQNLGVPQISTPQPGNPSGPHHYPHQYDEGQQRMQFSSGSPRVYPSPSIATRQMSNYASPMTHSAQLAYGQQQYFGGPPGQIAMQMRPYPGTPSMIHAQPGQMHAPMMVQQPSNGPYMQMPQQYAPQMQMYSPNTTHVYPQQNGYNSPGRMAPMMVQQSSQQSHHSGQPMMYAMSAQGAPMGFQQQQQQQQHQQQQHQQQQQAQMTMARGGYGGPQYGSSPHQLYPIPQRTMSSGYVQMPQKSIHQAMQPGQGAALGNPQQSTAYSQMEINQDDGK